MFASRGYVKPASRTWCKHHRGSTARSALASGQPGCQLTLIRSSEHLKHARFLRTAVTSWRRLGSYLDFLCVPLACFTILKALKLAVAGHAGALDLRGCHNAGEDIMMDGGLGCGFQEHGQKRLSKKRRRSWGG